MFVFQGLSTFLIRFLFSNCISVRPQIACEVETFFSESPDLTSPGFSSEEFYVGIKASRIHFN